MYIRYILNDRIVKYLEDLDWFVDEQNGFRRGRSCQEHVFSLTSIIRNRVSEGKPTFASFVDIKRHLTGSTRTFFF